jgi:hypothetical protein
MAPRILLRKGFPSQGVCLSVGLSVGLSVSERHLTLNIG